MMLHGHQTKCRYTTTQLSFGPYAQFSVCSIIIIVSLLFADFKKLIIHSGIFMP